MSNITLIGKQPSGRPIWQCELCTGVWEGANGHLCHAAVRRATAWENSFIKYDLENKPQKLGGKIMRCPSCKNPLTIAPLRANFYQCYNSGCPLNYVAVGEALSDEEEVVKKVTYDSVITLLYDLKIPALLHLNDKQKEVIFKWVEQWQ